MMLFSGQLMIHPVFGDKDCEEVQRLLPFGWTVVSEACRRTVESSIPITVLARICFHGKADNGPHFVTMTPPPLPSTPAAKETP
jgi:hypothetical protein